MKWGWLAGFGVLALVGTQVPVRAMEDADCLGCHAEAAVVGADLTINPTTFATTPHAEVGCEVCHAGVSESHPDDGRRPGRAGCGDCHAAVEAEYARSVHAGNAGCVDCHNPHAVKAQAEVSGEEMNRPCANCHDRPEMAARHSAWLPQASVHLSALPCITCHTDSEKMVLELYLSRPAGDSGQGAWQTVSYGELASLSADRPPERLLDANADQMVSLDELQAFTRERGYRLRGLLVPAVQTHSYDILYNRWDCTFCHGKGPASLQTSYLSLPLPDGSFQRLQVERGAVLTMLYPTPDFYLVGATRNMTLNLAGVMILAGGLVMPVGHGLLRFLTRKNRKQGG